MNGKVTTQGRQAGNRRAGKAGVPPGLAIEYGFRHAIATCRDGGSGETIAFAAVPTAGAEPASCLREVLGCLPLRIIEEAGVVSLDPTLMPTVLLEGNGGRACLVLIGCSSDTSVNAFGSMVCHVGGGHDARGDEVVSLDEKALRRVAREYGEHADGFAVCGYFGMRNPEHENRARRILSQEIGKPVTCGHELSMHLDASKRAAITAANAVLMPVMAKLVAATEMVSREFGIDAPCVVTRSDGTFMGAEAALRRPVETVSFMSTFPVPPGTVVGTAAHTCSPGGGLIRPVEEVRRLDRHMFMSMAISHTEEVLVRRHAHDLYHVHTSAGRFLCHSIAEAIAMSRSKAAELAMQEVKRAGVDEIFLEEEREDLTAGDLGLVEGGKAILESRLRLEAHGCFLMRRRNLDHALPMSRAGKGG